jgi:hypothetical protein
VGWRNCFFAKQSQSGALQIEANPKRKNQRDEPKAEGSPSFPVIEEATATDRAIQRRL